ncbi:MAG TPA: gamma-glutamyltransferase [Cyclobacteriaceae bacterium]|nr:gamma-glutamyltransferase [Cyclobacteriaceae bacterium]
MKNTVKLLFYLILLQGIVFNLFAQSPEYARHGMVVSSSQIASDVGRDILKSGGNAIDAAVATAFALAVTWPSAGNIGGGGFIVYMNNQGAVTTIDFREKAPLAATPTMYLDEQGNIIKNSNHDGILAVGVPGTVAGLYKAHQQYGKLPWKKIVNPAVKLASRGVPFTYTLYNHALYFEKRWKEYPSTAKVMYKEGGTSYQPDEIWKQPDLAKTLKQIKKHGRDGFYQGTVAKQLTTFVQSMGGIITNEDLLKYEAIERKPVKGTYRGYDVYSMPPPSSGGVSLIQMLNILEGYDLKTLGYQSADYVHVVAETMRRAYANRAKYLGDPDFNEDMPLEKLMSKDYGAMLRSSIKMDTVTVSDSINFSQTYESPSTTHFSVMDKDGNAVSLTYTLEYSYGSQIVADGLGFFLNNEMGDFNPTPGVTTTKGQIGTKPNLIEPGKRMLSSMTPTIIAKDGRPFMIIGSPGGRTIINTVLQVVLNVIDNEMNIAQSIDAPRFHHQWLPDIISAEFHCLSPDTQTLLEEKGHKIKEGSPTSSQGAAMGIVYDAEKKLLSGHADPRSPDGGVSGY